MLSTTSSHRIIWSRSLMPILKFSLSILVSQGAPSCHLICRCYHSDGMPHFYRQYPPPPQCIYRNKLKPVQYKKVSSVWGLIKHTKLEPGVLERGGICYWVITPAGPRVGPYWSRIETVHIVTKYCVQMQNVVIIVASPWVNLQLFV